ncbi:MAG: type II secretion system protein [Verrucomicrobiaceae bacterium]|nr:type II secretion system protein [Verrucomicrobiaceae bacterium]
MKTPTHSSRRPGYTLIEILVVVSIISLLAAMTNSAIQTVLIRTRAAKVATDLKDLVVGISMFTMERSRVPVPPGFQSEEPFPLHEGSPVLAVLLGENRYGLNASETVYISPKPGSNGAGGLVGNTGSYGYMDPWGQPYYLVVDASYNERVPNPDKKNSHEAISSRAADELFGRSAAMSSGPDKRLFTKDDIVSWR